MYCITPAENRETPVEDSTLRLLPVFNPIGPRTPGKLSPGGEYTRGTVYPSGNTPQ